MELHIKAYISAYYTLPNDYYNNDPRAVDEISAKSYFWEIHIRKCFLNHSGVTFYYEFTKKMQKFDIYFMIC